MNLAEGSGQTFLEEISEDEEIRNEKVFQKYEINDTDTY